MQLSNFGFRRSIPYRQARKEISLNIISANKMVGFCTSTKKLRVFSDPINYNILLIHLIAEEEVFYEN
jgi:hypothetical protein